MKRTSRNRSSSAPRAMLAAGALLLLVFCVAWRGALTGLLWRVAAPVLAHNPAANVEAAFENKAALAAQNGALRAALASTSAALADRDALYQENLTLKALLGRAAPQHSILAGIILRPPMTPYDTLVIDAGSAQGVTQGALVSAGGTAMLGHIDAVYPTTARVALFSAPGESYQAILMESAAHGAVPLTVVGQGDESFIAEAPADTDAAAGDSIVLPGVAGGYTGEVSAVDKENGRSFETLYMQLPVNVQDLRFVEVLGK